jgi:hypothetical protein
MKTKQIYQKGRLAWTKRLTFFIYGWENKLFYFAYQCKTLILFELQEKSF